MSELKDFKCPNCGGRLEFDTKSQKLKCPYCDGTFDPEIFDAVQEYFKAGLLQEPHFLVRQAWFAEHPEILKRREENAND